MRRRTPVVRGYAALITTLIVCTVLTALCLRAGTSTYLTRLSALEYGFAAIARANAYSCAQIALFEISADWQYQPRTQGDLVTLSRDTACTIESVVREDSKTTVTVSSDHNGFEKRLEILIEKNVGARPPFTIISFREI